MQQVTREQFTHNAMWKLVELFSTKLISLAISLVLARLLLPENYGVVALTTVFLSFSDIFIQSGFNTALIQKKEVDDVDYSTVLYLSLLIAAVLYCIIFFAAPFISQYYDEPVLRSALRVISILLFFQALAAVRRAMIVRNMQFRLLFFSSSISNLISGIVGIGMAYFNFGVWALVTQQVLYNICETFILFILMKWKPVFVFSWDRVKKLFPFGSGVLLSSLLDFVGSNIASLAIGRVYSVKELGYYNKGGELPQMISLYTFNAMNSVLLPTLASRQSDLEGMKAVVRKVISMSCYVIFPVMAGMMVVSNRLIVLLLTEKWLLCVPVLQWMCVCFAVNPLRSINGQVYYALGKSRLNLRIEVIRCTIMLVALFFVIAVIKGGIVMLAFSNAIVAILVAVITQVVTKKLIAYNFREWFHDIMPPMILSFAMSVPVYFIGYLPLENMLVLLIQFFLGAAIYTLLSILLKVKDFYEIVSIIRSFLKRGA